NLRDAERLLEDAARKQSKNSEYQYNLGLVLEKCDKPEKALEAYKKSAKLDPTNMLAHFGLANMYQKTGKFDLAVEEYKASLSL
ncbi:tetratricopeptide repeat protein, partial [Enterococcus faecalis]|uniref:tetratricopeptide repeat protein n=1 Tax=Enterococcus faecalis TaxID=1351 RepID=UPI003D6BFC44